MSVARSVLGNDGHQISIRRSIWRRVVAEVAADLRLPRYRIPRPPEVWVTNKVHPFEKDGEKMFGEYFPKHHLVILWRVEEGIDNGSFARTLFHELTHAAEFKLTGRLAQDRSDDFQDYLDNPSEKRARKFGEILGALFYFDVLRVVTRGSGWSRSRSPNLF